MLFCDMTGSTALGESLDAEALRALLARYFERLRRIVEAHGGTVEKFIGDAVVAMFGVPVVHEDDALRAVRAAAAILEALPELGVQVRIGINTGEVVTGVQDVVGDAVNLAARLEQAAAPGEVLLGAETARRVRNAVDLEPVPPLTLKGKSKPVTAYRLVAVEKTAEERLETPMIGREPVLRSLVDALDRAVRGRSCQLLTVLGAAGVGKSRLVREFVKDLDARVVRGRCLPYGEGITYWPVIEVVNQLGLPSLEDPATIPLRSLLGQSQAGTSADEIAWAFRKLLERHAQESALICVFDDLHWAEETFLDLVEHFAELARDAPILLLCLGRPELLDRRASWGVGNRYARTLHLEPLDVTESDRLLDVLEVRDAGLRERIIVAAEGNPLFVEEMVALVRESDQLELSAPPTIQALLAARLDQLEAGERSVLERGAVEGRVFHRSAVQALADDHGHLTSRLVALVRKDLLKVEPAQLPDDEAYRFRHLLIRDVAYEAIPKADRAELHQRFAAWLDERHGGLIELDELVGHHLGQAARYKRELERPDAALDERAGTRVAAAGRRALWRGDNRAAEGLLRRAVGLLRPTQMDISLELDFASAQPTPPEAAAIAEAAAERAANAGDERGEAVARAVAAFHRLAAGEADVDELDAMLHTALPLLEEPEDHASLVHVWVALGYGVANVRCHFAEWADAAKQALKHARLAGQRPAHLFSLDLALVIGPAPADEAVQTLDAVLPETPHPHPLLFRAQLLAMLGRFDEAWPSALEASERLRELTAGADGGEFSLAEIAALSGDYERAASHLRGLCDFLTEHDQRGLLSTFAPMLGRTLCRIGSYEEAEPQARLGRELGKEHDVATQALWRQVQALVEANRGRHVEAEALAREASDIIERTDALNYQGAALYDLAEVLICAGRKEEALDPLAQALERYSRKMNLAAAAQTQARIASLREDAMAL
jgi:tetratricopeptide (TPR) repeat protein